MSIPRILTSAGTTFGTSEHGVAASRARAATPWRFLSVLCAAGALLLCFRLGAAGLWLDEVMSHTAGTGSWSALVDFFRSLPEQHPLYYLILRPWLAVTGSSDQAMRLLSVVFAVATIVALHPLASRIGGPTVARLACVLLAVAPFHIYYGQEARMYSLLALLSVIASHALLRALDVPSRRRWVVYALASIAGVYTHLFFLFLLAGHGVFVLWQCGWRAPAFRRAMVVWMATAVAYAPWMVLIATHRPAGHGWKGVAHIAFGVPYTLFRFVVGYAVVPPNAGWKQQIVPLVMAEWPLVALAATCCAVLLVAGVRRALAQEHGGLVLASAFVPMALPLLVSVIVILMSERYFIVAFPFFVILLAMGMTSVWTARRPVARFIGRSIVVGYAAVMLVALHAHYFDPETGKEQWPEVASLLQSTGEAGEPILIHQGYVAPALLHYYTPAEGQRVLQSRDVTVDAMAREPSLWLVLAHDPAGDEYLEALTRSHTVQSSWSFPRQSGIRVFRLTRRARST